MTEEIKLKKPWLVAVWPGMGNVAVSAGYYMMAKLGMHHMAEFPVREPFDIDHVEVKDGIIQPCRLPQSRFFVWQDPRGQRDLVMFIAEAQPPTGRYVFCQRLIEFAKALGVQRVYTFAALATQMQLASPSRVFVAATDAELLNELKQQGLATIGDGHVGGMNGILLGVVAESGLRGACLLGEMPHIFAQLPFPRAALAVLETFGPMAGLQIDFTELAEQANNVDHKLGELLVQMQQAIEQQAPGEEQAAPPEPAKEENSSPRTSSASNGSLSRQVKIGPLPTSSSANWTNSVSSKNTKIAFSICLRSDSETEFRNSTRRDNHARCPS